MQEKIKIKERNMVYRFYANFVPISTRYRVLTHERYTCIAVENIMRKGEIACNKQFLLFSQCFLLYMALNFHFECTLKCRLQFVSIWTSLKFCRLVMGQWHIRGQFLNPFNVTK